MRAVVAISLLVTLVASSPFVSPASEAALGPESSVSPWSLERITDVVAYYPQIAVDSLGRPHIYSCGATSNGSRPIYGFRNSTGWFLESPRAGGCATLALTPDDAPYLAGLYDPTTYASVHGVRRNGSWAFSPAPGSSVVIDSRGVPHVITARATGMYSFDLQYAHLSGASWIVEDIPGGGGMQSGVFWVDMALGPDDTPHILFYDPNLQNGSYHGVPKVRYAHRTSSAWETDIVETTILGYGWKHGSIRVAPDGTVHVAYLADVSYTGNSSTLRYGIRGPAGWTLQSVDAPPGMKGFNPNVMISPRCGLPRIGYFWLGATGGRSFLLRLAAYDGEKWLFEDIFDMNPPSGFSPNEFAVDGFDRTHLVFNHMVENASALYGTTSTLFYAVRQPIPCAAPSIQITNPPDGAVVPATPIAGGS